MPSNTTRIAKNTLALYFRQILIMLVSLYTVRVVLETLGAEDYGIYNVAAGVVALFGFLSNSMASASQRYFAVELGRDNFDRLKKTFGLILSLYLLIALAVLLLAETVGLWFVNNKLAISPERKDAALWVYQTSIVSFLFTIFSTPYLALIIAHEDMGLYAFVSLFEAAGKLSIVFVLRLALTDKLKLYGILMCGAAAIYNGMYTVICRIKYDECKSALNLERKMFREILSFSVWKSIGSISGVMKYNGINILLNQIFNPLVVVARGIAISVNIAVESFSGNFLNAVRPKIIKLYAGSEINKMFGLVFFSTKCIFFLIYIFVVPVIIELPVLFSFWLETIPEYAIIFTRLMLVDILLRTSFNSLGIIVEATGKIKAYQLTIYGIALINLPGSWFLLSYGKLQPYYIVLISIMCTICINIAELFFCRKLVLFPVRAFVKEVLIPVAVVTLSAPVLPVVISLILDESFGRLCLITAVNLVISSSLVYAIVFKKSDRENIHRGIRHILHWDISKK